MVAIFISYSKPDAAVAGRLAADLGAAGADVWMAPGSIKPGESFGAAIDRGLENSEYVVVLLAPAAMASSWVRNEVYAALDRTHRGLTTLLPLLLQPVVVPPLLSGFQQIDFSDYERGLSALGAVLGIDVEPVSALSPVNRSAARPADGFTARVLAALEAGTWNLDYAVQPVQPGDNGFLDAVIEIALLRIGVVVQRGKRPSSELLADIERELRTNRQRVAAVLAVAPGDETALQDHRLLDATTPNAVVLTWAPNHGGDAVSSAVPLVVDLVTGRVPE